MELNELRIGNWIIVDDLPPEQVTLEVFATLEECPSCISLFRGIPITPERLERFGLVWSNGVSWAFNEQYDGLSIADDDGLWGVYNYGNFLTNIEYVHQLQNLFHSLTGEELVST